ncbi:3-mercaptopyruvate sulfurtransferase [Marinivivus vitaminiproducens]|uniref:3-mercaptopyruvate sulfurtransferase n=1 Tax=Marinivivus vitaminiproducens TaxID=3035935 RepID=UPI0027A2523B|nr:3-mercaptopyruvate sulfurtransferase [Geminicoccaceae bacterium SCSIO 64248]
MATSPLVSTEWLQDYLAAPDVRIVDATWFLPTVARDARAEHAAEHIPGAVFVDIDAIADPDSDLPHMLPSPVQMSARMRQLGIGDGNKVVVYDNNGFMASARVWWQLRVFGHEDVVVLDGGLAKWRAEGRPVTDEPTRPRDRHFTARLNSFLVRELDQMRGLLADRSTQVVDARAAARFKGEAPEPRAGLRAGHMPGALNLPYTDLIDPAQGTLLPGDALKTVIEGAGIDPAKPLVTTCGSGVSACVINLALHRLGHRDVPVYDGSWTEWGGRSDTPVV